MVVKPVKQPSNIQQTYNNNFFENPQIRKYHFLQTPNKRIFVFEENIKKRFSGFLGICILLFFFGLCIFSIFWGHTQGVRFIYKIARIQRLRASKGRPKIARIQRLREATNPAARRALRRSVWSIRLWVVRVRCSLWLRAVLVVRNLDCAHTVWLRVVVVSRRIYKI